MTDKFFRKDAIVLNVFEDSQRVRMKISARHDVADGFGWRCSKCGKRVSLRKDTFTKILKAQMIFLKHDFFVCNFFSTAIYDIIYHSM